MATTPQFFDNVGMKYEEAFGHDPGLIEFVRNAMELLPEHASVLDIGCGTGKPLCYMLAASGRQVHGIDESSKMVELSRKQVPKGTFEQVGMTDFQPQTRFDAAFATFSIFGIGDDKIHALMERINSWIVPNGHLFIGTMAADDFKVEPHEIPDDELAPRLVPNKFMGSVVKDLVYTKKGWISILQRAGFEVLKTATVPFSPPEDLGCNEEPHHYITARKLVVNGTNGTNGNSTNGNGTNGVH
jgi:cyclopropane fatty-acyl-phospholipid synthase-like methyltransferase